MHECTVDVGAIVIDLVAGLDVTLFGQFIQQGAVALHVDNAVRLEDIAVAPLDEDR